MSKNKQGKKHIHILDGMSLYTRDKSPYFWGYLNLDGEIHKKSLKTSDMKEAEKLLFDWKNELLYSDSIEATNTNADVTATKIPKVDNTRRKALMITSSLMGAVTVAGFAVPFLSAWNPSEKAKALGASVKFDLSKLEPGAMAVVEWRRTPIFVVHQTPKALENLPKLNDRVISDINYNMEFWSRYYNNFFDRGWYASSIVILFSNTIDILYYDIRISLLCWVFLAGLKNIIDEKN